MKTSLLFAGGAVAISTILGSIYLTMRGEVEEQEEQRQLLLKVLKDLKLEYIPVYTNAYNLYKHSVQELNAKGDKDQFIRQQVREQSKWGFEAIWKIYLVDNETHKADQNVCEKYGISLKELEELLDIFEGDSDVQEIMNIIEENNTRVFNKEKPDFKLDFPVRLNEELYLEILETIQEVFRHEGYCRIRYLIRTNQGSKWLKILTKIQYRVAR